MIFKAAVLQAAAEKKRQKNVDKAVDDEVFKGPHARFFA